MYRHKNKIFTGKPPRPFWPSVVRSADPSSYDIVVWTSLTIETYDKHGIAIICIAFGNSGNSVKTINHRYCNGRSVSTIIGDCGNGFGHVDSGVGDFGRDFLICSQKKN